MEGEMPTEEFLQADLLLTVLLFAPLRASGHKSSLLLSILFLSCGSAPVHGLGVRMMGGELAVCLWKKAYFDMVLETENFYAPFWGSHVASSIRYDASLLLEQLYSGTLISFVIFVHP